jgi:NADPH:quinone reductase-like Zn-dependent oxidoreductase
VGSGVVGFLSEGAWAERVAVPAHRVGLVPGGVDPARAAGVPVAGLTAMRALRVGGMLAGSRVLVLGATGAVGRIAVQLAAAGGARVLAHARSSQASAGLRRLGADEVHIDPAGLGQRCDLIVDTVGGAVLTKALRWVAPGGAIVLVGDASHEPASVNTAELFLNAPEARMHALRMDASGQPERMPDDLAYLASAVADGRLDLGLSEPRSWTLATDVLTRPAPSGEKPVLLVDAGSDGARKI